MVRASHIVEEGKAAMKMQGRFGLATAVLLVIPTFAQAQHAMGNFRAAPSAPASAPVVHSTAVRAHTGARTNGTRASRASSATTSAAASSLGANDFGPNNFGSPGLGIDPLSAQILDPLSTFGFGFDFAHAVAVRDAELKAFIDPATQQRLALAERRFRRSPHAGNEFFFLDGGGAYVLPVDAGNGVNPDADTQAAQDQNQDQGQNGQGVPGDRAQQGSQQGFQQGSQRPIIIVQQPAESKEQSESLPDEGEFTLILRSGQEIQAVAFTRVGDRIVYITTGGGRRTVAVREVDVDATVRLNQERGTPLQIPL
jgi:hypothetical protein